MRGLAEIKASMTDPIFHRFAILGAGLIGSSLALALKAARAAAHVELYDPSAEALKAAARRRAADGYEHDLAAAVREADAVCLAAPVDAFHDLVAAIARHLETAAILTDVGSVKAVMARSRLPALPEGVSIVPAHPLAGDTRSGADAAREEMFRGARVVLTPEADTPREAVEWIAALWRRIGAEPVEMSTEAHDAALAWTSHLPQAVASALMAAVGEHAGAEADLATLAGAGLRDTTRLAASDPDLWSGILLENRAAVAEVLAACSDRLRTLAAALEAGERDEVRRLLEAGRVARTRL